MLLLPDLCCTIEIEDMSINELKDLMRKVEDGHVMVQTVALEEKYTGERNIDA